MHVVHSVEVWPRNPVEMLVNFNFPKQNPMVQLLFPILFFSIRTVSTIERGSFQSEW